MSDPTNTTVSSVKGRGSLNDIDEDDSLAFLFNLGTFMSRLRKSILILPSLNQSSPALPSLEVQPRQGAAKHDC